MARNILAAASHSRFPGSVFSIQYKRLKASVRKWIIKRFGLAERDRDGRTSYAQEGEDVLLWRILDGHHEPGFFVEVGCNHPAKNSNTAFLYQRGWNGIGIDPNPDFALLFKQVRPKDIFVLSGVGEQRESLRYFRFHESLYNTFSEDRAKEVVSRKLSEITDEFEVPIRPLTSILSDYWPEGRRLRFLSIDCEGMDLEVLKTLDLRKYPVDFICVEMHYVPLSDVLADETYQYLTEKDYVAISKLLNSTIFASNTILREWNLT